MPRKHAKPVQDDSDEEINEKENNGEEKPLEGAEQTLEATEKPAVEAEKEKPVMKAKSKSNLKEKAPAEPEKPSTPPLPTETSEAPAAATAPKTLAPSNSTLVKQKLVESFAQGAKSRDIDVVFAFDTTASMLPAIMEVRKNIAEMSERLLAEVPGIRIGMIAFADYDSNSYTIDMLDLCSDKDTLCKWVRDVNGTIGYTAPEAYELVLRDARKLSWRASNRALVLIGDSFPHSDSFTDQKIFWGDELAELIAMKVKVYGVFAKTESSDSENKQAEDFYQEISDRSGGIFLELRQFQLMSDMFMAVCFKELSDERVEAFRKEIEEAGSLDEDRKQMFGSLKRGASKLTAPRDRDYQWWNKGCTAPVHFYYNESKNTWSSVKPKKAPAKAVKPKEPKPKKPAARPKRARKESDEEKEEEKEEEEEEEEKKKKPAKRARKAEKEAEDKGDPEVSVGDDFYVRGDSGDVWLARVTKVNGKKSAEVKWFEEFARYPGNYALVNWKDSIPLGSFISKAKVREDGNTGMFVRTGKLPSI